MTRIIAGAAGGLRLQVPASGTRPTSDRVREAMFSALEARDAIRGALVADLYAGSGALGLEAASRGARDVVLVEKGPAAAAVARANANRVADAGAEATIRVVAREVASWISGATGPFDLVFIDPPYELGNATLESELARLTGLLSGDGLVLVERSTRTAEPDWPDGLTLSRTSDYGDTRLYWLDASLPAAEPHPSLPSQPA